MKKGLMKKLLKATLAFLLAFSVVETSAFTRVSALEKEHYTKVSDPNTMDTWKQYFESVVNVNNQLVTSTGQAGYIWSDKTVLSSKDDLTSSDSVLNKLTWDEENFLVSLSALSANSEVVGYSTIPTDTMIVLDLSNSMTEDAMYAMVEAVNKAIDSLLTLNKYNRVGVAVYDTDASVLLPLDSYTTTKVNNNGTPGDTSDDYLVYLELDDFEKDGTKNTGDLRVAHGNSSHQVTVTVDYSGVDWNELNDAIRNANSYNRDDRLEERLSPYIPSAVSIDWSDVYNNKPEYNINNMTAEKWKTYIETNYSSFTVDTYSVVKNSKDEYVISSVEVGGGTYMQYGMWNAWNEFKAVTDTTITDGILAGTVRMPVMVLMSDGAPTYNTTYYNAVTSTYNSGNGSNVNNRNGFLTQLTGAWIKKNMANHYGRDGLFYTLGLDVADNDVATSVLNPSASNDTIDGYWETFLKAKDGDNVIIREGQNNSVTVIKDATITSQDFVNQYYPAKNATGLISAFASIVNQIILQSKYYPTKLEQAEVNMSGYMNFVDELGEYMEVKSIKGIASGEGDARKLYTGDEFAQAFIADDIFGDISSGNLNNLNEDGQLMIKVIMKRLGVNEEHAKVALSNAITTGQISYTSATEYSNYIGWYADADGDFIGVWDGNENATRPEKAVSYVKDYGFFGDVGSAETFDLSNMSYIVARVATNIETKQQTVNWAVPASLVPVITYSVAFEGMSYDEAQNPTMEINHKLPICFTYEVGLRSDINEYNISALVDDAFLNEDGTYSFYTNMFNRNADSSSNPNTHNTTTVDFKPSEENARYYYIADTLVLDDNHEMVSKDDFSSSGTYYRKVVAFNKNANDGTVQMVNYYSPLSKEVLPKVKFNDDGYAYVPKGTAFSNITDNETEKSSNNTGTLDYFNRPVMTIINNEQQAVNYLGNNGKIVVTPQQGLLLYKEIEGLTAGSETFQFTIEIQKADKTPFSGTLRLKDTNKGDVQEVNITNGKLELSLKNGNGVYIVDLPTDATYSITEANHPDYMLKTVSVNDVVTGNIAQGTIKNKKIDNVVFTNAVKVPTLLVSKEVEYPFELVNSQVDNHEFTVLVDLGANYSNKEVTVWGSDETYTANANGVVTLTLKDGESVMLNVAKNDTYTITETNLPAGYTMNADKSVNLQGTIITNDNIAKVVNTYAPTSVKPTNVTIDGTKGLTGREWLDTDSFTFILQYLNGNNWETMATVDADKDVATLADKTVTFTNTIRNVEYTQVGEYRYRVIEVNGGSLIQGITYDSTVHTFTIKVTDNDLDGQLEVSSVTSETTTVTTNENTFAVSMSFANTYAASGSATATIEIQKEITNYADTDLSLEGYQFVLKDLLGNVVAESTVTTNEGTAKIVLELDISMLGSHQYKLSEIVPTTTVDGMVYDSTVYDINVNVVDKLDGTIGAILSVDGVTTNGNEANVSFNNVYDEETQVFTGNKVLSGRDWKDGDTFSFELYETASDFDETAVGASKLGTEVVTFADASKAFTFDEITYKNVGTHYYVIKEVAGTIGGITYDTQEYRATVTLTRDDNNQLVKTVTFVDGEVEFTNTYEAADTTAEAIVGTKTMSGRNMSAGEFTFNLYQTGSNYSIEGLTPVQTKQNVAGQNGEETNFAFDTVKYDEAGTYYYVVTETKGTAGGVTYDARTYRVNVVVVDNLDGTMTATVNYVDGAVEFTNTYKASETSIELGGTKTMDGRDMTAGEFTFNLFAVDAEGNVATTPLDTVTNVAALNGVETSFKFEEQTYTQAGTYVYAITETKGTAGGVTYDETTYLVTVTVTDNNKGSLVAEVTSITDAQKVTKNSVAFLNTYKTSDTELVIKGTKRLNGRDMNANEFTFNLYTTNESYGIDGLKPIQTVTNVAGANGEETTFAFASVPFKEVGEYYYVVTEEKGTLGGITYDQTKYDIKVVVKDNLNGTLTASVVSVNGKEAGKVAFVNTYKANVNASVVLDAQKDLQGRDWKDSDQFTFELYTADENYNVVENAEAFKTLTVTDETVKAFEEITYDTVGTYYYVMKETYGGQRINGISYSTEVYKIEVTVTDNYNGTLSAATVIKNSNDEVVSQEVFVNTYTTDSVTTERIKGTKTLVGRDMSANEFTFNLYETDETFAIPSNAVAYDTVKNEASANGVADAFTFKSMTFDKVGTYYYAVVEEQTEIAGVTMDTTKFIVTIKVADDTNGKLYVKELLVNGSAENKIAFVNKYSIDPTPFEFGGYKTLRGRKLAAEEFTFNLYESDVTFTNRNFVTSVNNTEDGSFMFTGLEKAVGTYYYVVEEAAGTVGGVTYDATHYHVTVEVVDNGVGGTTANVKEILKVTKNEEGTVIAGSNVISFVNKYVPVDNDGIVIGGNKTLTGRHTIDGEFTFELYEADENYTIAEGATPIRTVNEANTFAFEEVYFNKVGNYYFVVKELDKNAGGMAYDTASFNVHVAVTDDGKGELHAAIVSINGNENGTITFNNTYTIEDKEELVISGVKEFTGREWTDEDVFTFELYETNDEYEVSGATLLETKTATKGNVNFSFSKLVYKSEETHYYVVREVAGATDNGITYDTKQYQIKVVVTDNHDGTLTMNHKTVVAGTEVTNIKFVNTYEVFDNSAAYVDIVATKALTGRPLKNAEFTFELYEAVYDETTGKYTKGTLVETVKNANTEVKFTRIKYTEEGTHHYIVKEQAGDSTIGITYDSNEYPVTVVVYDDGNGRLAVNKTVNGEVGSITINNTYTVTPDEFKLSGTKTLTGRDMEANEFVFDLYQATDATFANRTLVQSVKNNAAGEFEFVGLSEQPGTYYYVIEEQQGSKGGVTYDASHYHVVVTIVDNGNGTTEVSSTTYTKVVEEDGKTSTQEVNSVVFNNTYVPTDSTGLVLGGNKALAGRHTIDGEFTFELYKTGADFELVEGVAPIQTVNEDDKFEFKPLTYPTTGTHYYVIKELDKNAGGMTYDTATYRITVEVTDDLNGELVAEVVSMTDADGKAVEKVTFNNSYEIEKPITVIVNGNKVLTGREWLDSDEFTFELYEANSNYEVSEGATPLDTQTATKGNTAFVFDEFTYDAEETHYYVVKEVVGTLGGVTYDTTVFNVKVVVTDNHDGTLSVEKTYYVGNSKVNNIEFVNTYEVLDSSKAYATIRGTKSLTGRVLANGEFEFELYGAIYDEETEEYVSTELLETVKNTATAFTFSAMEYSEVGTHYYVVKEKAGELGGVTYDETVYVIEVTITDGYDGKLYSSVDIINSEATVVAFNNTYTIYPDTFSFEAVKTLTGREMTEGEFSFELYETNSSYKDAKLIQTIKNDKDGKVEFAGLSKYPGTYYYVIKEVAGSKGGVSYDSSYYQVKIVIVDEGNGTTKIENTTITKVSITEDGAVGEPADKVLFANTYTPTDSDGIVIEGAKNLTGRHMINGEFTFELYDADGNLKQTVVNKDGKFAFKELFFDEVGTYTYVVKEKDLGAGGMSYDSKEIEVVIKVTDDLNGELDATIVSINGSADTAIEFNNTYEITKPNSTIIEGYKTFTGREWTEDDVFTFELYEANADYEVAEGAKPLDTQKATKDNVTFAFDEITYDAEDTHYYVVKEVVGDTTVGITYDTSVYNVKVVVTDNHDGTLSVAQTVTKNNTVVEDIEFVNTYEVYEGAYAQATISGIKTLTTRPIKDAEFTFDLYQTGSDFAIIEGSTPIQTVNDGVTFTFETIKYDKIGTYYYVVKEMNAGETLNGVTYDEREHKVQVDVTDGGKGYLVSKVTVVGKEDNTLVVDNKYTITPTEFSLDVNKVLTGRDMNDGEFTFELYESDATFANTTFVMSTTNDAEGNATFEGLAKQPGTYYYVISEKAGSKGGVTYDAAKYQVTVTVADNELGGTVVTNTSYVKVTADGAEKVENVVFNNKYEPKDTDGIVLGGIKLLTGRQLVNGEFVFELFDKDGELLLQTTVNKDGRFEFTPLTFEETGTYVYTIKERNNGIGGITYDPTVFKVTIEVEDDLNGELVAKVSEIKASGSKVDAMIFENTYKAEPIKNVINGIKVLTGRDWLETDEFTFELYETESDFEISGEAIDTAIATKEHQEFTFDEITYDKQGEYYYVVKEVAGTIGGVTYDVRLYNVKVTVTDMLDGTFTLKQEVFVDDEVADMIEFVNPYSAKGTGLTLFAQKEIEGRDLVEKEFVFDLFEASAEFVINGAAIQSKENAIDGKVVFDELAFEEVGTYYYVIAEKAGNAGGVTYDDTKYFVTISVTDDLAGNLVAEIASITTNKSKEAVEDVMFNNTYAPAKTVDGIVLTAKKVFNGRELVEGQFTFNLFETDKSFNVDAVALQTAVNDALGNVTFAEMNYDKVGSYYYVITEEIGNEENIIYDTARYMVEVQVTDDKLGQLHAEVVSITKEGENAEEVVFENTYFVNTADTTTANGWLASMFVSVIALIVAVGKKRKLSK